MIRMHNDFHIVTVGERGQVVIPAGIRKSFGVAAGDKLVVFARPDKGVCLVPMSRLPEIQKFLKKKLDAITEVTTDQEPA